MSTQPLVQLRNVSVSLAGNLILSNINWSLRRGENWAILGGNGSGKTTFLKLVRGEISPVPAAGGERIYALNGPPQHCAIGIREKMGFVSPEVQERYLQQEWTLTAREVIYSGFFASDYLPRQPTSEQIRFAQSLIKLFELGPLHARNIQQLSTGQLRRILIARALVSRPPILILDEVCDGLDAPGRERLLNAIDRAASTSIQLLFTTHRRSELPRAITHLATFQDGQMIEQKPIPRAQLFAPYKSAPPRPINRSRTPRGKLLISIQNADVFLERRKVLANVHWEVRQNEHWAIFGRNGAGKSTLLKLAVGDLFPAWRGKVSRFDFTRNHTLWDLRKKVGFVSPDFQALYRAEMTGQQVIASGFFSTVGINHRISARQKRQMRNLIGKFHAQNLAAKPILRMSYGEFRKILLLRALLHAPALLVCDEPFDGLDERAKLQFSKTLAQVASLGTGLIVVTHHLEDLPPCMTHGLLLEEGRIVCQGELEKLWKHPGMKQLFGPV